jgi:MFS family permease
MSDAELRIGFPGWRVALAASLASMAGFGSILIYSFGIFLKPLSVEFGWTRETISIAFACASFTLGLCSPGLGWLLDRYGPRRIVIPCIITFGLAFGSLSLLTNSRLQLFGTFILIGVVGNATAQMGYARAVSSWFREHRGLALALLMAGSAGGTILVPIVTQRLIGVYGWRATYAILGAVPFVVALPLVAIFLRERPAAGGGKGESCEPRGTAVAKAMRSRAFWLLAGTLFLTAMSTTGIITHLSALLTDRGISRAGAALAVGVVGGTSVVGRLLTGWILDHRFGPRVNMILLFTTAAGLLLLSDAKSVTTGITAAALIGFSMGGEADVTPYLLGRYFGLPSLGTLYGFMWTAYAVAAALGSVLLGKAFDSTGSYTALLLRLALFTFVAGLLMLGMPRYADGSGPSEDLDSAKGGGAARRRTGRDLARPSGNAIDGATVLREQNPAANKMKTRNVNSVTKA